MKNKGEISMENLKKRIEEELNVISCGVQIFTYHGFCCDIIEEFPEDFDGDFEENLEEFEGGEE